MPPPREVLQEELQTNTAPLEAANARVEYLQEMIKNLDQSLVQEDPNHIPELKQRLAEAVQVKERLIAEKEKIERELSAK